MRRGWRRRCGGSIAVAWAILGFVAVARVVVLVVVGGGAWRGVGGSGGADGENGECGGGGK